jgi:hypothetical protein
MKDLNTKLTLFKVYEYDYNNDEKSGVISEVFSKFFLRNK